MNNKQVNTKIYKNRHFNLDKIFQNISPVVPNRKKKTKPKDSLHPAKWNSSFMLLLNNFWYHMENKKE